MIRSMREQLIKALIAHAHGDIQKHVANVEVYLNNPVGIGEHPQQVEEAMTALEKLANANDKLDNLLTHFGGRVTETPTILG